MHIHIHRLTLRKQTPVEDFAFVHGHNPKFPLANINSSVFLRLPIRQRGILGTKGLWIRSYVCYQLNSWSLCFCLDRIWHHIHSVFLTWWYSWSLWYIRRLHKPSGPVYFLENLKKYFPPGGMSHSADFCGDFLIACVRVCMSVWVRACMFICVHACVFVCACACVCVCLYLCVRVCM